MCGPAQTQLALTASVQRCPTLGPAAGDHCQGCGFHEEQALLQVIIVKDVVFMRNCQTNLPLLGVCVHQHCAEARDCCGAAQRQRQAARVCHVAYTVHTSCHDALTGAPGDTMHGAGSGAVLQRSTECSSGVTLVYRNSNCKRLLVERAAGRTNCAAVSCTCCEHLKPPFVSGHAEQLPAEHPLRLTNSLSGRACGAGRE
jgi:hypothetical protein